MAAFPFFGFLILFCCCICFVPFSFSNPLLIQFLYPNTSFTYSNLIDNKGAFLSSPNSTFTAAFLDPGGQQSRYYLALIHFPSNSLVWAANPNSPVPYTATVSLSSSALSLSLPDGSLAWSTPPLPSPIHALQLLDSGNLLLLDSSNSSLWQSFEHPTDTLLPGQRLPLGSSLASPASDSNLSDGGYRLSVTANDVILKWRGSQQYWSLYTDSQSFKDYNTQAAFMEVNGTGLYLFDDGSRVVFQVVLPGTDGIRVGKLESSGHFRIVSYESGNAYVNFVAPTSRCDLPFVCSTLGLCLAGSNQSDCGCPQSFGVGKDGICSLSNGSVLASSSSCSESESLSVSYLSLGSEVNYFANKFTTPISGSDFRSCQDTCSSNCSCLGFFHKNSSMSCYLVQNQLGSLIQTGRSSATIGYVKTLKASSSSPALLNSSNKSSTNIVAILLPLIATTLLLVVLSFLGFRWRRKRNEKKGRVAKLNRPLREINIGHLNASTEDEFIDSDEISIPGLPTRFTYDDLALVTNNFRTLIGSGGFGSVYKGELPDKSLIAVKKITNIGIQGKKEFCTEIAVIGNIHHVNLVKLRGYCSQGSYRFLVYEYMNRGSLESPLFGPHMVLDWQERFEIAIGVARGLAYLHSGCDHRILHFDIKPENILLADNRQVKIADFGLSKLMNHEQSKTFTKIRGTRGYMAPEWLTNSAISDKTDVYSYGMVLLEIVGGSKNCSTALDDSTNREYFPLVALEKHMEGRWLELVDPRLEGSVIESEVMRLVKVALCCLHEKSQMRPSMTVVVGMLEGTMAVQEPRVGKLKFLRMYRRGARGETVGGVDNFTSLETSTTRTSLYTNVSAQNLSGPR